MTFAQRRVLPTIRRALPADCDALTRLMHASAAYQGEYAAILSGYAISPAQLAQDHVYLAESDGRALGFYSLVTAQSDAELDLLFVEDAAQGQEVGASLFAHMKALAASLAFARVKIVAHPPAEGFYVRMGAQRVGVQPPSGRASWNRPVLFLQLQGLA